MRSMKEKISLPFPYYFCERPSFVTGKMNGDSDCSSSSSPLRQLGNYEGGGTSSYSVQDILYPADAHHPAASFDPAVVIPPHHHYHSGLLAVTSPVPPTNNFGKNFLIKLIKLSKKEEEYCGWFSLR